jgi:hypothetical protein
MKQGAGGFEKPSMNSNQFVTILSISKPNILTVITIQ